MGWTIRNTNKSTAPGTTVHSLSAALAVVTGDIVIASAGAAQSSGPGGTRDILFSDDVHGAWPAATEFLTDRPSLLAIGGYVATGSATLTIAATNEFAGDNTMDILHVACYSHDGGTIPGTINNGGAAQGGVISSDTVNITTTTPNCLIIANGDASGGGGEGAGFVLIFVDANNMRLISEYQLTNSAGVNAVVLNEPTQRGILAVAWDPPTAAGGFIPIIGRGPGLALAGHGGLVAKSMKRSMHVSR